MNLNLVKKKVLVTGSSRGIGLEIAKKFLLEGCSVVLNGRSETSPISADTRGAHYIPGNVATEEGAKYVVSEAATRLGGLDIVICNVGSGRSVPPGEETLKDWQESFSTNFFSTTCTVEAAKVYLKDSSGTFVCISSICGCEVIPGAPVTYSVAKAALNAYVKSISRPLGLHGIRICGIAPGNILFDGSVWDAKLKGDPVSVGQMLKSNVALNKLGSPADISSLALFLASPISSYATGCVWVLDGGQTRAM